MGLIVDSSECMSGWENISTKDEYIFMLHIIQEFWRIVVWIDLTTFKKLRGLLFQSCIKIIIWNSAFFRILTFF